VAVYNEESIGLCVCICGVLCVFCVLCLCVCIEVLCVCVFFCPRDNSDPVSTWRELTAKSGVNVVCVCVKLLF
jgi:hypothetical protein